MSVRERDGGRPWVATGVPDENARRLVNAVYRHRRRLAAEHPMEPVQGYVLLSPAYGAPGAHSAQGGLPVGALLRLWEVSPVFRGRCPACGGTALGFAAGGMLDWHLHGVCRRCAALVHRLFFRSTFHAEIDRCLAGTPYRPGSGAWLNGSNGQPHTRLVAALARLGARRLPDPGYGFLGGTPAWMREAVDPVAARAQSWAWRAAVTHGPSGAVVEPTPAVLARVSAYVESYLRRTGRFPELEHDGGESLRFAFPMTADGAPPTPTAAAPLGSAPSGGGPLGSGSLGSGSLGSGALGSARSGGAPPAPPAPRWLVCEIRRDPVGEEVVWQSAHDDAHGADLAFDARVTRNRLGRQGLGEIVVFDRWERRVVRETAATPDASALIARFLGADGGRTATGAVDTGDEVDADVDAYEDDAAALDDPDDALQADVDRVLAAWRAGRSDEPALARLTDALESDLGSYTSYESTIGEALPAAVAANAFAGIDDEDVRAGLGLSDRVMVRDAHRVRHFEEHVLPGLLEDADVSHAFTPVPLVASDDTEAVLLADVQGYSFSGVTVTWHGPYASAESFVAELLDEGWIIGADAFAALSLRRKRAILRGSA